MRSMILVARKDLAVFFRSPLAWLVMTCILFLSGYFFVNNVVAYQLVSIQLMQTPDASGMALHDVVNGPLLQNLCVIFLFFLPLLTMRTFSEEKKLGTLELLLSYPVNEWAIVGGKLLALAFFMGVTLLLTATGPVILTVTSGAELLPLAVGYGGLFLMVLSFAALGLLLSSLTENQIVSASMTFGALLLLWLFSWTGQLASPLLKPVFTNLSMLDHFVPFAQGVISFTDTLYYVVFICVSLVLTVISLEGQRKGGVI